MPFYKYRTDLGNTVTAKSSTSFTGLLGNEAQISSTIDTPANQQLYLYKVSTGLLVENDDSTMDIYFTSTGIVVNGSPTIEEFTGYTGTTAPATYALKSKFNTYTGTTAPTQFASKLAFLTFTGTTAPATYVTNTAYNLYIGTTAPVTYQSKVSINVLTGTTLPATYQSKTSINTYTGTTAPATYLSKTSFNAYSASTLTNINNRLLTSSFNTYSGNTAVLINTKIGTANNGLSESGINVRLGGALTGATTITSPATGSRLSFAGFPIQYSTDVSANYNPRSLVDKGYVTGITSQLVYGTQYQLASALATSTTTSTTPVAKVTMTTSNLPSGTYKIMVHWMWSRNSTANSARFNVTIGGVAQGTRTTMEMEAGDTTDIRPESRVFYAALSGVNSIVFNHWAESNANTTSTSDATIELIRVA